MFKKLKIISYTDHQTFRQIHALHENNDNPNEKWCFLGFSREGYVYCSVIKETVDKLELNQ